MTENNDPDSLAKTLFWLTMGGSALFISAVFIFVL